MNRTALSRLLGSLCTGFSRAGIRISLLLALLFAFAAPGFGQARRNDGWWNEAWKCRRTVEVQWPRRMRPGEEATAVAFPTGGYLQSRGEDIRVIAVTADRKNVPIPHKVIFVGPGDRASLMFPCKPRGYQRYHVYYGNPDCAALEVDWTPQRGLIMETRPYKGGACRNWAQMKATLARAGEPYGRALVDNIFHGLNPFGPSRNFVTTYTGWLYVPPGEATREIALSSAGAAFLFVDDKPFLVWPNWHRAIARGRYHKPLKGKSDPYKIAYYHVQANADPIMVLAWKTPDEPRYEAVPAEAFMRPLPSRIKNYHVRGQSFASDFVWWNRAEAECRDRFFVEMGFTDASYPKPDAGKRALWDFGDGITSTKRNPTHVYLATGTYAVTLTYSAGGKKVTCRQNVVVDRNWSQQRDPRTNTLDVIASKTRNYDLDKLSGPSLFGMLLLQRELGREKTMLDVGSALVRRISEMPPGDAAEAAVILSTAYRESVKDRAKAIEVLRACEAGIKAHTPRARLALVLGDIHYYDMNQPATARPEYERVVRDYSDATQHLRMAYMRLGDIERQLGKLAAAQRFYRKALDQRTRLSAARESLNMAMRALETEDYLRRSELDAAAASLDLWQWQQPEEKLRGQWSVLKARHFLATKDIAGAMNEAETLLRVNPESQYAPEALLLLAQVRIQNREYALAQTALDRLKVEYRDSPLATGEEAEALRKKLPAEKP